MTTCNVEVVARSDKCTKNYHNSAVSLSFTEHLSIFKLIVLVLQLAALMFRFALSALIGVIFSSHVRLFSVQTDCTLLAQHQTAYRQI